MDLEKVKQEMAGAMRTVDVYKIENRALDECETRESFRAIKSLGMARRVELRHCVGEGAE